MEGITSLYRTCHQDSSPQPHFIHSFLAHCGILFSSSLLYSRVSSEAGPGHSLARCRTRVGTPGSNRHPIVTTLQICTLRARGRANDEEPSTKRPQLTGVPPLAGTTFERPRGYVRLMAHPTTPPRDEGIVVDVILFVLGDGHWIIPAPRSPLRFHEKRRPAREARIASIHALNATREWEPEGVAGTQSRRFLSASPSLTPLRCGEAILRLRPRSSRRLKGCWEGPLEGAGFFHTIGLGRDALLGKD